MGPTLIAIALLSTAEPALDQIVASVREALAVDPSRAENLCSKFRVAFPYAAEGLEACSWVARDKLARKQLGPALQLAQELRRACEAQLKGRQVDSEPHLPIALGAAIEVEAQAHAGLGERPVAIAGLETALKTYAQTSIANRLQKNLNLLTLTNKPAPPLESSPTLTATPAKSAKHQPTLFFFWAHWCPDCKKQAPVVARLRRNSPHSMCWPQRSLMGSRPEKR